ncbi:MAG: hypothetical protein AB7F64_09640 [Gammaproteobacteria bacterium]
MISNLIAYFTTTKRRLERLKQNISTYFINHIVGINTTKRKRYTYAALSAFNNVLNHTLNIGFLAMASFYVYEFLAKNSILPVLNLSLITLNPLAIVLLSVSFALLIGITLHHYFNHTLSKLQEISEKNKVQDWNNKTIKKLKEKKKALSNQLKHIRQQNTRHSRGANATNSPESFSRSNSLNFIAAAVSLKSFEAILKFITSSLNFIKNNYLSLASFWTFIVIAESSALKLVHKIASVFIVENSPNISLALHTLATSLSVAVIVSVTLMFVQNLLFRYFVQGPMSDYSDKLSAGIAAQDSTILKLQHDILKIERKINKHIFDKIDTKVKSHHPAPLLSISRDLKKSTYAQSKSIIATKLPCFKRMTRKFV